MQGKEIRASSCSGWKNSNRRVRATGLWLHGARPRALLRPAVLTAPEQALHQHRVCKSASHLQEDPSNIQKMGSLFALYLVFQTKFSRPSWQPLIRNALEHVTVRELVGSWLYLQYTRAFGFVKIFIQHPTWCLSIPLHPWEQVQVYFTVLLVFLFVSFFLLVFFCWGGQRRKAGIFFFFFFWTVVNSSPSQISIQY